MISALRRLLKSTEATAAVEAAIFAPIFVVFTLGIADLGVGMFVGMTVNTATQAGASYAVFNSRSSSCFPTLTATCLSGIKQAMNDASGNSSFCSTATCIASLTSCADPNGGSCYTVSAGYLYTPIFPGAMYSWAQSQTYLSTVTVRFL
jgi:TadE-like protein